MARRHRLLLRVDRLELTKNIVRGFKAYELLLEHDPSWRSRVRFLAMLSPSRVELPEYREYAEECLTEAERINDATRRRRTGRRSRSGPETTTSASIAAYGLYDVLFVNPVIDGMNLVAMEGPAPQPAPRRAGALA